MPKVACFEIPELTCWFWSSDHEPPHFHAKKDGEWELRVKFMEDESEWIELIWGTMPGGRLIRQIRTQVAEHRDQLLQEWEAKVKP